MLSAAKNFAITFAASALIFGIIAYFVAGAVENGITAAGDGKSKSGLFVKLGLLLGAMVGILFM